ncbi:hypothetical protein [Ferribacterium limneticum]|uniref:hypothetical protein n=1 Tax=Ferribacterium limneticum TaxID=76259 RepID=UPI001CFA6C62|nr:hypothetical protein [Ferribacterium limneticum]UCV19637.1 hypothetical protein KI610_03360 [Ferribacterium limneticum]
MRSLLIAAAVALTLTACATQSTPPAAAPAPAAAAAPAPAPAPKPAPQCYNGDSGKFEAVGTMTTISGVKVTCEKTSDGKNAQWMGVKK